MLALYLSHVDNDDDFILLERIYYAHRKQMLTLAVSILENEDDAEDLVHDVFCKIAEKYMQSLRNIKNEQDMKNYLLKATKNSALNKKRDAKPHISFHESEYMLNKDELIDDEFLDTICNNISYQEVLSAIKKLDKKYEDVLYLHFVIGMTVSKIADRLGRNTQTVKKQLSRGKTLLMEKILIDKGADL